MSGKLSQQKQSTRLSESLKPANESDIMPLILAMKKAGLVVPSGIEPDDIEKVYPYALRGVSKLGVSKAVRGIISGKSSKHVRFMPTPPELAEMARAKEAPARSQLADALAVEEQVAEAEARNSTIEGRRGMPRDPANWRSEAPKNTGWKPPAIIKAEKIIAGKEVIDRGVTLQAWSSGVRAGTYPVGATYHCALQLVSAN